MAGVQSLKPTSYIMQLWSTDCRDQHYGPTPHKHIGNRFGLYITKLWHRSLLDPSGVLSGCSWFRWPRVLKKSLKKSGPCLPNGPVCARHFGPAKREISWNAVFNLGLLSLFFGIVASNHFEHLHIGKRTPS